MNSKKRGTPSSSLRGGRPDLRPPGETDRREGRIYGLPRRQREGVHEARRGRPPGALPARPSPFPTCPASTSCPVSRKKHPGIPAIVVTASDSIQDVIGAMPARGRGLHDQARGCPAHAGVPWPTPSSSAPSSTRSRASVPTSPRPIPPSSSWAPLPAMDRVRQHIRRAAASEATVLIFRGKRHRQGTGGPGTPHREPARGRSVRRRQQRRPRRNAPRERALRP